MGLKNRKKGGKKSNALPGFKPGTTDLEKVGKKKERKRKRNALLGLGTQTPGSLTWGPERLTWGREDSALTARPWKHPS